MLVYSSSPSSSSSEVDYKALEDIDIDIDIPVCDDHFIDHGQINDAHALSAKHSMAGTYHDLLGPLSHQTSTQSTGSRRDKEGWRGRKRQRKQQVRVRVSILISIATIDQRVVSTANMIRTSVPHYSP